MLGVVKQVAWGARKGLQTNLLSHLARLSAAGLGRTVVEVKLATSIIRDRPNWV